MNELSSSPTSLLFLQAAKHAARLARQTFNHFLHSASSVTWKVGSGWAPQGGKAATQLFPEQVVADARGQTQRQEITFCKEETLDQVKWILDFQSTFNAAMKQESGNVPV